MIRILKLVFLLVISQVAFAQAPSNYTNINGRYRWIAGMFDSTFHIPKGTTPSLRTGGSTNPGALFYKTGDSSLYIYTGTQWLKQAGTAGFVPYSGATDTLDMGQFGVKTKFVQFDTSSREVTDRTLQWSNDNGTLAFGMTNGSTIEQEIGLQQFARVKNVQGSQINKGQVVYLYGASGDRAAVKLADNRADSTSSKTLGIAIENIPINGEGFIGTFGTMTGFNTTGYTAGDILYLDSIPGGLTKTKPQAPYHLVFIGIVEKVNAGAGLIFTNVQNGYELEELHNVKITSPVRNNALLVYDSLNRLWVDTTITQAGLAVTSVATNTATGITGGTITTTGTLAIDTLLISTRAWRQKGIDSIKANYVPYTGATTNVNLGVRTLTATGVYSNEGMYVANTYGLYGRNAANNASPLLIGITGLDKVYIDGGSAGSIFGGNVSISVLDNVTTDTDQFLVSDGGVVKYRTGAQVLSDIGGASSSSISGTTNYIPKFTSSSAIGNSVIYESSSNIGIGTITPATPLAIKGSANNTLIEMGNSSTNSAFIQAYDRTASLFRPFINYAEYFAWEAGGSERMRLTSTGLGIGTSSPASKLSVGGSGYSGRAITAIANNTDYGITFQQDNANGAGLQIFTTQTSWGNTPLVIATSSSNLLTLNSSGNLGLSVTPSAWLSGLFALQNGAAHLFGQATGTGTVSLGNNNYLNSSVQWIYQYNGKATRYSQYDGQHEWYTAGTGTAGNAITFSQAMTLNASGNLGLGVTPSAWTVFKVMQIGAGFAAASSGTGNARIFSNTYYDGSYRYVANGTATQFEQDGYFAWYTAPSGTAGNAISFTQAMTLDASGRLGVGVTSPSTTFDVNGTINVRTNGFEFGRITTNNVSSNTGGLTFQYNASGTFTTGMVLNGSGNVGVGTSSPTSYGATYTTLAVNGSSSGVIDIMGNGTVYGQLSTSTNIFSIEARGASTATRFITNGDERMRITSGGNVLIGTTTDGGWKLSVSGNDIAVQGTSAGNTSVRIASSGQTLGSTSFDLISDGSAAYAWNRANLPLVFGTNATERMRITSGGELLINTTSNSATSNVGSKFVSNGRLYTVSSYSDNTQESLSMYSTTASAYRFYVGWGGTIYATNTTISAISDARFKENVRDLDSALNKLMLLKPRVFDWKEGMGKNIKNDKGFIAQEFEQIFPELVDKWKEKAPQGQEPYKSIRQDLIPYLVKAIQELKAEIETLKNK